MPVVKPVKITSTGQQSEIGLLDTIAPVNLGTGTLDGTKFLRDDGVFVTPIGAAENSVFYSTDFINSATTTNNPFFGTPITAGTSAQNTTNLDGNHPGVVRLTSSTIVNGGYRWKTDPNSIRLKGGEVFIGIINPLNFTTTTVRIGFHDATIITDAIDGVYFEYATNGNIVLKASNNNTRTTSAIITTLTLNTWFKLKITLNANATSALGEVFNSVGVLIASQTVTTNIPTLAGRETSIGIVATESTVTATPMVDLDYLAFRTTLIR